MVATIMSRRALFLALACTACGDDGNNTQADAKQPDAPPPTVVQVDPCPMQVAATVTTVGFTYSPMMTMIGQGQVVKFDIGLGHDVTPLPPMTDTGLVVPGMATRCLRFTSTGTFNFKCTPHGFTGSVVVN
jgi:plastocyanin